MMRFLELLKNNRPGNTVKMHVTKQFLNLGIRLTSHFIPKTEPKNENSLILQDVHKCLSFLLSTEFAAIEAREGKKQDQNFERLVKTTFQALIYLSESDPFYELWLGMMLKTIQETRMTHYLTYAANIQESAKTFKEQMEVEITPEFCTKAYNYLTCGGLQLLLEKLQTEDRTENSEVKTECHTAQQPT